MIITNAPLKICGLQKPQWGQNVFEIWVWIFTPVNFMRNFGSAVEASAVAVYVYDFSFRVDAWEIWHQNQNYRKVVSSRLSQLVAQSRIFWHIMKGNFDVHLLRPLAKRVQNWIVDRSTARNFTVHEFLKNIASKKIQDRSKYFSIQPKFDDQFFLDFYLFCSSCEAEIVLPVLQIKLETISCSQLVQTM